MDVHGTFFRSYEHKYRVVHENAAGEVKQEETEWIEVGKRYFFSNENNLGMELVSKGDDGKINKSAGPAGFNSYVGNKRYGEWVADGNGGSFWRFYGQYMFMSQMFGLMARPAHYNDYYSTHRFYRPYYGPKGTSVRRYGTTSPYTKKSRPNFYERQRRKNWSSSSRSSSGGSRGWSGSRGFGTGK
jgi:hypothetical protein